MGLYFTLIWLSLVIAPIAAVLTYSLWLRRKPLWRKRVQIGSAVLLAVTLLATWLRISFFSDELNVSWCIAAYFAYVFLISSLWQVQPRVMGVLLIIVGATPVAMGYFMSTVGVLGLMFMAGAMEKPAAEVKHTAFGEICITRSWDGSFSDSGYTTTLYAYPSFAPFIRRELQSLSYNETHPDRGDPSATCDDVIAAKG